MELTGILVYVAVGLAIAAVVMALVTIASKKDARTKGSKRIRLVLAVTVGFVIAFSLATHQSVIERNRSVLDRHAAIHGVGTDDEDAAVKGSETG